MTIDFPFVGRADEMALLRAALTREDRRGAVLIGAPGTGKTRLLTESLGFAERRGATIWRLSGDGAAVPLGVFSDAGPVGTPPLTTPHAVVTAVRAAAEESPVVLCIDDAHLLDAESVVVVQHLVRRRWAKAVLALAPSADTPHPLLRLWKDHLLQRVDLLPLGREPAELLVAAALGHPPSRHCMARLFELSAGFPALLERVVEDQVRSGGMALHDGQWEWTHDLVISSATADLVALHVGDIGSGAEELVDMIAAVGPINRVHGVMLTDGDTVADAERSGVLRYDDRTQLLSVAHPLLADVRRATWGALRGPRLRGRMAMMMRDSPDACPARLGELWLGSDLEPDPSVLAVAAEAALDTFDLDLADRCAGAAMRAGGGPEAAVPAACVRHLRGQAVPPTVATGGGKDALLAVLETYAGTAPTAFGPGPVALRRLLDGYVDVAADLLSAADAAESHVGADLTGCVVAARVFGELGRLDEMERFAARGWHLLDDRPQAFFIASLAEHQVNALLLAGAIQEAGDVCTAVQTRLTGMAPLTRRVVDALNGAVALTSGDLSTALRLLDPAELDLGGFGELTGMSQRAQLHYVVALARAGRADAAAGALRDARQRDRPGSVLSKPIVLLAQAWVAAAAGDTSSAQLRAEEAARLAGAQGLWAREVVSWQTAVILGCRSAVERLRILSTRVQGPRVAAATRHAVGLANGDGDELLQSGQDFAALGDLLSATDADEHAAAAHMSAGNVRLAMIAAGRAAARGRASGRVPGSEAKAGNLIQSLTGRQQEIIKLIADGRSNRDIAEHLSVSVRTVEGHIYRACVKTGATTREALAELATSGLLG